jgi:DNA-binding NarL/FixJ family response regulator
MALMTHPTHPTDTERRGILDLTEREREVLALMATGRSNAGIGTTLFISRRTVEQHVEHIFTKLGLRPGTDSNRRVLGVLLALHAGIGAADDSDQGADRLAR